jgi:hypothetical protein
LIDGEKSLDLIMLREAAACIRSIVYHLSPTTIHLRESRLVINYMYTAGQQPDHQLHFGRRQGQRRRRQTGELEGIEIDSFESGGGGW